MKEMAERLMGQTCIFFSMFSESVGSVQGVLKALSADGGAVLVEKKNGDVEILNLEYIVRIRPVKKRS